MSVDEKTGMQAREQLHEPKPVRPGLTERIEFEYRRHVLIVFICSLQNSILLGYLILLIHITSLD